jgi:hypothetical protein
MWGKNHAVQHLRNHAAAASSGHCARSVRQAIAAGGVHVQNTESAKDYGPNLTHAGFAEVPAGQPPRTGDVVVIQPIPNHPHGHMAMYDGHVWISDFRQYHGMYPGPSYRALAPTYRIYRKE